MTHALRRNARPTIGACLRIEDIPAHRDWLFEADRDLEVQSFFDTATLASGAWRDTAVEAARLLDGFRGRRGIHGPFQNTPLSCPDAEMRALIQARFLAALDACAAIGGNQMVIHSPFTVWDAHNLGQWQGAMAQRAERVAELLGPVLARAEREGITLVVENIEDVNPADRRALVEALGSPVLALSVDTGHAHYAHVSHRAPPVDYFVRDAGPRLAHVHLQDADGHADRHWPPGRGSVNWPAVFDALDEIDARPRLVLELRDAAFIPEAMAHLTAAGLAV